MQTVARPLLLDLRAKTVDEVVETLIAHGYQDVRHYESDAWKHDSLLHTSTPLDQERVAHCVAINQDDAPMLTVISHNGQKHTLRPGHDLYFFEGEKGGWGWARTYYLYA